VQILVDVVLSVAVFVVLEIVGNGLGLLGIYFAGGMYFADG